MQPVATVNGIVVGIVSSLEDPENLARAQVTFSFIGEQVSRWAKLVSLNAGNDRGALFRPEVDDEVLVGFELGDPDRPYILGALWNSKDPPPAMGDPPEQNNWRVIKSRSGHILKFNDEQDAETIELRDKDDKRTLIIDTPNEKIEILCDGDSGAITVKTPNGVVEVEAKSKISLTCTSGDIAVKADGGGKIDIQSTSSDINVSAASGSVKVNAAKVEVSAGSSMKLSAGTSFDIESGGVLNLKGGMININ